MVKKQITLETNPTQPEKISYLQKDFNLIAKFGLFNKIVKLFNSNPNQTYFNYIQGLLTQFINFENLNYLNPTTFALVDGNGKIIIYFNGTSFSTFTDYTNNIIGFIGNEQQEYLILLYQLQKEEKYITYFGQNMFVGQTNTCIGYNLVAFSYLLPPV